MRTLLVIPALMLSVTMVAAQGKKPGKPVPVVAQPTSPVQAQQPQKATERASSFQLAVWGGYNLTSSDAFAGIENSVKDADSNFTNKKSSTITKGGIAGGMDIWLGSDFQYGLGVSYLQVYKLEWANTEGAGKANIDASIAYLPVHLQGQYNIAGFKFGFGAGLAMGIGDTKTVLTGFGVGTDTNTTTKVKGTALSAAVSVAYGLNFGNVTTDIGVRYFAIFDDKIIHNIAPNITLGYKF